MFEPVPVPCGFGPPRALRSMCVAFESFDEMTRTGFLPNSKHIDRLGLLGKKSRPGRELVGENAAEHLSLMSP